MKARCLFCGTTSGKRTREHVFRHEFRKHFPPAPSLTFSHWTTSGHEVVQRPITQFDITVNQVCRQCNNGWLNDLENEVTPVIRGLSTPGTGYNFGPDSMRLLGYWTFVRALLRTHASPHGHAPGELFEYVFANRSTPPDCFVQLGTSTHYVAPAGAHQSARLMPGDAYIAYVSFGLGALLFLVSMTTSPDYRDRAFDVIRQPRLWFPDAFIWLSPWQELGGRLRTLAADEAEIASVSFALRMGISRPLDHMGNELDPASVIPERFLSSLAWPESERY